MKRRIFLEQTGKATILVSLGLSAACGGDTEEMNPRFGDEGIEIDLTQSPFDALATPGNWVLHPNENILIVNDQSVLKAYTSVCTHTGCTRNWSFDNNARCTCHGSEFNRQGQVVRGPANRDLNSFSVSDNGDSAVIS